MLKKINQTKHLYTALAISSKVINSFFILKILSILLSNKNFVDYMLFLNSSSIFQFIFTLGLTTGIIAQSKNSRIYLDYIFIFSLSIISLLILLLINTLLTFINPIIIITSLLISLKLISFSILNGLDKKKEFTIYCSIDSLLLILLIFVFNHYGTTNGYIYAYLLSSTLVLIMFLFSVKNHIANSIKKIKKIKKIKIFISRYKVYFYMSLFSAFIVPTVNFYIRSNISSSLQTEFNIATLLAAWRMNESLLMVVGTISSIYFIQKFNSIKNKNTQLTTIYKNGFYFFLLTLTLPILTFMFPQQIITIILNNKYTDNYLIFSIMFIAFSLRAYTYILGLYLVIHRKVLPFICIEIFHTLSLLIYIKCALTNSTIILSLGFILQSIISYAITIYYLNREH